MQASSLSSLFVIGSVGRARRAGIQLMLLVAALLALGGLPSARAAGPAALVKDVNPTTYRTTPPSVATPNRLVAVGGRVFFVNYDINNGYELWVSDGTAGGTRLVRDINPGPQDVYIGEMIGVGSTLFFAASAYAGNPVLWRSDGTAAGTLPLAPTGGATSPSSLTNVNGIVYFVAQGPNGQYGLWKSDGTSAGTVEVKVVGATHLTAVGGKLFFVGQDGAHGSELWASDGTPAGTQMVKDINPSGDSFVSPFDPDLTAVGGKVFFITSDYAVRDQLWQSDGTSGGTTRVLPTDPSSELTAAELENAGGTLYFHGTSRIDPMGTLSTGLWKSDGSAAGTVEVKSFYTGTSNYLLPTRLKAAGGRLFFAGDSSYNLWTSDGTASGTKPIGSVKIGEFLSPYLTDVNGTLFFAGDDGTGDVELWRSDGTGPSTVRVKNINLSGSSEPSYLVHVGTTLYFAANSGQGRAFWRSDGTDGGTTLVKDSGVTPSGIGGAYSSQPLSSRMRAVGGTLFFVPDDGVHGSELWVSDGTGGGTHLVKDINPSGESYPSGLTAYGGALFFTAADATSVGLWKSNGTTAGTTVVKSFARSSLTSGLGSLTILNGMLIFATGDSSSTTLWKSDGTSSGTVSFATLPPGSPPPIHFTAANGRLFFVMGDSAHGVELWTSDGAASGTRVLDMVPGANGLEPLNPIDFNGTLCFIAGQGAGGYELWKSDGTPNGTVRIKSLGYALGDGPRPDNLTVAGSRLFFTAFDATAGVELWASDGTPSGTKRVKDINTVPDFGSPFSASLGSDPAGLANVNGRLLFTADDGLHGRELWRSDGTESGTVLVKDINPGAVGSAAGNIQQVRADGRALFAASNGLGGVEVWQTDGTPASTMPVQDIAPGAPSSNPAAFTVAGSTIFFVADDGSTGSELWALNRGLLPGQPERDIYLPLVRR